MVGAAKVSGPFSARHCRKKGPDTFSLFSDQANEWHSRQWMDMLSYGGKAWTSSLRLRLKKAERPRRHI